MLQPEIVVVWFLVAVVFVARVVVLFAGVTVVVTVPTTMSFASPHSFDPDIKFLCFLSPVMLLKKSQLPSNCPSFHRVQ